MGSPFPCLLILLIALIAVALALFIGISFVLGGAIAIQRAARVDSMSNPAENDPEEHALESAGDADISNGTVAISEYTGAIGLFLR